jgi:hypothetical protein
MPARTDATAIAICRATLAFIWIYQGVVPKLLGPHEDELAMDLALGFTPEAARIVAYLAGAGEVAMGIIVWWVRRPWPLWLTLAAMIGLLGYAALATPQFLLGAFNPVTINAAMAALALVSLLLERE